MSLVAEGLAETGQALIWARLGVAIVVGLVVSFLLNRWTRPAGDGRQTGAARAIQASVFVLAFAPLLLATRRPAFAAALVLAGQLALVLVNNAKYRALREPLLFADVFEILTHAVRHPRLYLPFFGLIPAILCAAGVAVALYLGVVLEPPLSREFGIASFVAVSLGIALVAAVMLAVASAGATGGLTLDPGRDFSRLGLVGNLWVQWLAELRIPPQLPAAPPFAIAMPDQTRGRDATLPHVVVVQSESFFDPRAMYPAIRRDVLAHYDALLPRALCQGRLDVPAWGANTLRPEFAFLSGLPPDALGIDRFSPYRRLARRPLPTLASWLRSLGYRTICIHPYPAAFYGRDRAFPNFGFDRFLDIREFGGAEKAGAFIADSAVTRRILDVLGESDRPAFVFAITMENHGPLHLERPEPDDADRFYSSPPPAGFDDLTVYLRHLCNADAMIGALTAAPADQLRERVLCFFGDHVPIMPAVYARLGFDDGRSEYFIWRSGGTGDGRREDLVVEALGLRLLQATGLARA